MSDSAAATFGDVLAGRTPLAVELATALRELIVAAELADPTGRLGGPGNKLKHLKITSSGRPSA